MAVYTLEALSALLGAKFRVKATEAGTGFHVNLNLKDMANDYEKVTRLLEAFSRLKEAGYNVMEDNLHVASQPKERGGVWPSWLTIYVASPSAGAGAVKGITPPTPAEFLALIAAGVPVASIERMYGGALQLTDSGAATTVISTPTTPEAIAVAETPPI
jgi:hypothetical protein